MKRLLQKQVVLIFISFATFLPAVSYSQSPYVPETDTNVLKKLENWQDLKFGLLMHWGPYSEWGIVESWSICPEEYPWCKRVMGSDPDNYNTYLKEYENLKLTFNPVKFNPDKWAEAAKEAGMKYVIFTTKHHDGFCMFDTKYTDYKVTDKACPFSKNPKANITKEIFKSFRNKGFWVGAYFSKPDWHSPYYWSPEFPPKDRNVNYDPEKNPALWKKFVDYTHNQVLELVGGEYGKVDILWFDGGWVQKKSKEYQKRYYAEQVDKNPGGYVYTREVNQDIKMDELVSKVREKQPGIIVVDRAVYGKNQNYLTPENKVPPKALPYPWESCIISGGGWSYTPGAKYKSGHDAIQMLVDIVAKGGNLLLNIGPSPTGEWDKGAYDLLKEYAAWMKVNSEAIYGTRALAPFKEGNICMTGKKDGSAYYFYYMAKKGENVIPPEITINSFKPGKGAKVTLLGTGKELNWEKSGKKGFKVHIPDEIRNNPPAKYVWVLKLTP